MFGLLPKNFEFYDCFDRAVSNAVRGSEMLLESAKATNGRRQEFVSQIMEAEHEGDRLTHETLDRLEQKVGRPDPSEHLAAERDLHARQGDRKCDRRLQLLSPSR